MKKYLARIIDSNEKYIRLAIAILLCAVCAVVFVRMARIAVVEKYPREFRDGANIVFASMVEKGENPYSVCDDPMIQMNYVYTPLNNIIVAGIHKVVQGDIRTVFFVLDWFYIFISCILIAFCTYVKTDDMALAVFAIFSSIILGFRAGTGFIGTTPDHLAMLLGIILLMLVDRLHDKKMDVLIFAFITIILFYIKQYFVCAALVIFVYLMIKNRKKAMAYLTITALGGYFSIVFVNSFCTLFSINALYFAFMPVTTSGGSLIRYSVEQMVKMIWTFGGLILGVVVYYIANICEDKGRTHSRCIYARRDWNIEIWDVALIVYTILLIYLGMNEGAYMSYHYQLIGPALIVFVFKNIAKLGRKWAYHSYFILIAIMLCWEVIELLPRYYSLTTIIAEQDEETWNQLYEQVDSLYSNGKVFIEAPQLAEYQYNRDGELYDIGLNYFAEYTKSSKEGVIVDILEIMGLCKALDKIDYISYYRQKYLKQMIQEREIDYYIVASNYSDTIKLLEENGYHKYDTFMCVMGQQRMGVDLYSTR